MNPSLVKGINWPREATEGMKCLSSQPLHMNGQSSHPLIDQLTDCVLTLYTHIHHGVQVGQNLENEFLLRQGF